MGCTLQLVLAHTFAIAFVFLLMMDCSLGTTMEKDLLEKVWTVALESRVNRWGILELYYVCGTVSAYIVLSFLASAISFDKVDR